MCQNKGWLLELPSFVSFHESQTMLRSGKDNVTQSKLMWLYKLSNVLWMRLKFMQIIRSMCLRCVGAPQVPRSPGAPGGLTNLPPGSGITAHHYCPVSGTGTHNKNEKTFMSGDTFFFREHIDTFPLHFIILASETSLNISQSKCSDQIKHVESC